MITEAVKPSGAAKALNDWRTLSAWSRRNDDSIVSISNISEVSVQLFIFDVKLEVIQQF